MAQKKDYSLKNCGWCGKQYKPTASRQVYCSKTCFRKAKNFKESERYALKQKMKKLEKLEQEGEKIKIDPYYLRRGDPNKIMKKSDMFTEA